MYVEIYSDGELFGTYPLDTDKDISLPHNTVHITNQKVCISEADCPDRLCMHQGYISHTGETIACLPNRMVVKVCGESDPLSYTGLHFDTVVNVTIYDTVNIFSNGDTYEDMEDCRNALSDKIRSECERYELICSRTNPDSELYKLNHRLISNSTDHPYKEGSPKAYKISHDLYCMIEAGVKAGAESNGYFDISIAPLNDLWDFRSGTSKIPSDADIKRSLPNIGYQNIILLPDDCIAFTDDRIMIDLGGLAKGYIGDRLAKLLKEYGIKNATISLGGNIVALGSKYGKPFTVGVKKPFAAQNDISLTVNASDICVITSGTYERCFKKDGILYHHILDPATGYPVATDIAGATVICPSSLMGDILSTELLIEGSKEACEHAVKLKEQGIYIILLDENGNVIIDTRVSNS